MQTDLRSPARYLTCGRTQERNGQPFLSVHVGVRTTLLRAVYEPSLKEAFTLMALRRERR